jgi:very-short-patch-repair endonuclease
MQYDLYRDKLGRFKKGIPRGNLPEEIKLKISKKIREIENDETWKKTIGIKKSKNMSNKLKEQYKSGERIHPRGMLGKKGYWLGKHRDKETMRKMSVNWFKKGRISNLKGKTYEEIFKDRTDKIKTKIREARAKQIIPLKDTSIEIKIQNFLKNLQIEFVPHYFVHDIDNKYRCDIFIPSIKLVIECDGDYFHGNKIFYPEDKLNLRQKEQMERDKLRNEQLTAKGYRIIRLWENDINKMTLNRFKEVLNE